MKLTISQLPAGVETELIWAQPESPRSGFGVKVLLEKAHWLKSAAQLSVAIGTVTGLSEQ